MLTVLAQNQSARVGDRAIVVFEAGQRADGAVRFNGSRFAGTIAHFISAPSLRASTIADTGRIRQQIVGDVARSFSADSITRELKPAAGGHPFAVVVATAPPETTLEAAHRLAVDLAPWNLAPRVAAGARDAAGAAVQAAADAAGKIREVAAEAITGSATALGLSFVTTALIGLVILIVFVRFVLPVLAPVAVAVAT